MPRREIDDTKAMEPMKHMPNWKIRARTVLEIFLNEMSTNISDVSMEWGMLSEGERDRILFLMGEKMERITL